MKKLINVTFALLLLCSAVTLVSCGKDDDKKGGSEAPEGTRELSQNGITAKIDKEEWRFNNTVLYVTTDGEVLLAWRNGVQGQGGEFGNYWNGKECEIQFSIALLNGKQMKANSVTISKIEVYSN